MKATRKRNSCTIRASQKAALKIYDGALTTVKAVYIALANKKIKYRFGRSRIAYIGETTVGINRIATSAARRAPYILDKHGINSLEYYIISTTGKQKVKTWEELERSLLLQFRERFGDVPICNTQGKNLHPDRKSSYFREDRLEKIILLYSDME
ncbi:MAG: hypothetical protein K1X86_10195 [Ignavibacteria bacterium]|nr:hypothetical protein [Ignavibacteria bacterium]